MNYANLITFDSANGPGWRVSLFVSGCDFHCPGCFNEEAQDRKYGQIFTAETRQIIEGALCDPRISGLSLLGGDPLCQEVDSLSELVELAHTAHRFGKDVWLWSGFTWEDVFADRPEELPVHKLRKALVKLSDIFVDGQFMISQRDTALAFKGSSNQRIIDVKETQRSGEIVWWRDDPMFSSHQLI